MGQQSPDALDRVFTALAHPTRRSMVATLAHRPESVSRLAEQHGVSLTTVAKHLRVLGAAGLVEHHKRGRVRMCTLQAQPLGDAESWISDYRGFWIDQLDALAAHVEADDDTPR